MSIVQTAICVFCERVAKGHTRFLPGVQFCQQTGEDVLVLYRRLIVFQKIFAFELLRKGEIWIILLAKRLIHHDRRAVAQVETARVGHHRQAHAPLDIALENGFIHSRAFLA